MLIRDIRVTFENEPFAATVTRESFITIYNVFCSVLRGGGGVERVQRMFLFLLSLCGGLCPA